MRLLPRRKFPIDLNDRSIYLTIVPFLPFALLLDLALNLVDRNSVFGCPGAELLHLDIWPFRELLELLLDSLPPPPAVDPVFLSLNSLFLLLDGELGFDPLPLLDLPPGLLLRERDLPLLALGGELPLLPLDAVSNRDRGHRR